MIKEIQDLLPATNTRVEQSTSRRINDGIRDETERSVRRYAVASKVEITQASTGPVCARLLGN